jgi:protein arginine N-methyltransferase 1
MYSHHLEPLRIGNSSLLVRVTDPAVDWSRTVIPSMGEYPVYDENMYQFMAIDWPRMDGYRAAVRRVARDRVVLDIGTGSEALWATASAEAGARRVYAIEAIPDTAELARQAVARAGVSDRVMVIAGNSTEIELPEPADVCISEIIGTIGGSEGAAAILSSARRQFMAPGGVFIPRSCTTTLGAVDLTELVPDLQICFDTHSTRYVADIFRHVGRPFDVRLCMPALNTRHLLTTTVTVEEFVFERDNPLEGHDRRELIVTKVGQLHGFMLGIRLLIDYNEPPVDSMVQPGSWPPVFAPTCCPGVAVQPGDHVLAEFSWKLSDDHVHPDYHLRGRIERPRTSAVEFDWQSPYKGSALRSGPFYSSLFPPNVLQARDE